MLTCWLKFQDWLIMEKMIKVDTFGTAALMLSSAFLKMPPGLVIWFNRSISTPTHGLPSKKMFDDVWQEHVICTCYLTKLFFLYLGTCTSDWDFLATVLYHKPLRFSFWHCGTVSISATMSASSWNWLSCFLKKMYVLRNDLVELFSSNHQFWNYRWKFWWRRILLLTKFLWIPRWFQFAGSSGSCTCFALWVTA